MGLLAQVVAVAAAVLLTPLLFPPRHRLPNTLSMFSAEELKEKYT